jgi:MFS family permease
MLLFSSIFSFAGLQLLSVSSGMLIFLSAGIFAIGITFFWPTTLAYISENIPESGAFGLSLIGGLGMFSVSLVLPLMGQLLDNTSGNDVIKTMSILPFILIFLYGFLFIKRG